SQVAAKHGFDPAPDGLIFFGYPLHPPKRPDQRRDQHLPAVDVPMLFLSGTRDPFATPDELRALTSALPQADLQLFEGGDHSLHGTKKKEDLLETVMDSAARWIIGG